jgi:hypothetical protein
MATTRYKHRGYGHFAGEALEALIDGRSEVPRYGISAYGHFSRFSKPPRIAGFGVRSTAFRLLL